MNQLYVFLLFFFLFLGISSIFHLIGGYFVCRFYKISVDKIQLFYGKEIFELKIKNVKIVLGWIPTGGSIHYDFEAVLYNHSRITRILLNLAGPVFVVLSAAFILGPKSTIAGIYSGFYQIIAGAISPFAKGKIYISIFFFELLNKSTATAYALMATKIAALNLLPIPPLNGGNILLEFIPNSKNLKRRLAFNNIGLGISLLIVIPWMIALIIFFVEQL